MAIREVTVRYDDASPWEAFGQPTIQAACDNIEALWNMGLIRLTFTEDVDTDEIIGDDRMIRTHRRERWSVGAEIRNPQSGTAQAIIEPHGIEPVTLPLNIR